MSTSKHTLLVMGAASAMAASLSARAQETQPVQVEPKESAFIESIKAGKVIADVRLRYESVDDSINKDAKALTLRTRLGYETGSWGGFKLLAEFTDTHTVLGMSDYFPEQPAYKDYATIADPTGTELNRAVISYEGLKHTWLGLGRQRIILDNARWIGNVGWRQKEQTFDAGSVDFNFGENWKLSYDYMTSVQGVVETLDRDVSNNIINLSFNGWDAGTFVGYGYFLKDDDTDDTNNSIGIRFNGGVKPGKLSWLYTAEYARQKVELDQIDPTTLRDDYEVDYYTLMGGIGFSNMTVKAGYEVLGSDGGDYGLQTPLATKFAFNGWADMFLATPKDGLRDAYIDFGANWFGLKWGAIVHDFSADKGSDHYGRELDLGIAKKFSKYYTLGFKYADYRADDFSKDRKKAWLWFDFKY